MTEREVEDLILCYGNYGVVTYRMEWVHKREPERSRVTSLSIITQSQVELITFHVFPVANMLFISLRMAVIMKLG